MTAVTVSGVATAAGEPAAHYDQYGRLAGAHEYRTLNPQLPQDGLILDLDHDGSRVGTVVYAEVAQDERVHVVSVVDDGDPLLELDRPIYYSPLLDLQGCEGGTTFIADEARIIGLSLTLATARVAAPPLSLRAGDIRSSIDRWSWSRWKETPLLTRCVDQLPRLRAEQHRATRISDQRPDPFASLDPWGRAQSQPRTDPRTGLFHRGGGYILSVR